MPMFKKKLPEVPEPPQAEETPVMVMKSGKPAKIEEKVEEGGRTVQDYLTTKMTWELDILSILIEIRENLNTQNALMGEILAEAKK